MDIILVSADWDCPSCQIQKRDLKNMGLNFTELKINKNPDLAKKYNIYSLPTTIIKDHGIEIILTGYQTKNIIRTSIEGLKKDLEKINGDSN